MERLLRKRKLCEVVDGDIDNPAPKISSPSPPLQPEKYEVKLMRYRMNPRTKVSTIF